MSSQYCLYVIQEISLETYWEMQIINDRLLAFPFHPPIDCVYYGIVFMYAQQLDAVFRFMFICYLRIHLVQNTYFIVC